MLGMDNLNVSEPEGIIIEDQSTAFETIGLIVPTFLLSCVVTSLSSVFNVRTPIKFILEFILLVLPTILSITVFADNVDEAIALSLLLNGTIVLFGKFKIKLNKNTNQEGARGDHKQPTAFQSKTIQQNAFQSKVITNVRATTNFLTCVAILAVDFTIFPRRLTKNEKYGFSLMDLGVGLFIYSNGIVISSHKKSTFFSVLKDCIPLLVLGLARLVVLKQVDYNVPVQEYGVHWNFFITLAITKIICSLIMNVVPMKLSFLTAVVILVLHETGLQLGLADFVFSDIERTTFITANREGIVSILGYVGLYFLSLPFGQALRGLNSKNEKKTALIYLLASSVLLAILTFSLNSLFGVSRRLANSAYCFWVLFIGLFVTTLFAMAEEFQSLFIEKVEYSSDDEDKKIYKKVGGKEELQITVPLLFEAINYNGLVYFLISNLFTGLVNLVFNTFTVSTRYSLVILTVYSFCTSFIVVFLYVNKIKFKM